MMKLYGFLFLLASALSLLSCATSAPSALEYADLGESYYKLGRYAEAVKYYRLAVEKEGLKAYRYNLVISLTESGKAKEALPYARRLAEEEPKNLLVAQALAYAQYKSGDPEGALVTYRAVLAISPQNKSARYNRARIWKEMGRNEEALESLLALYATNPDDDLKRVVAFSYKEAKKDADALIWLTEYAKTDKAEPADLYTLADWQVAAKRYAEAAGTLRTALAKKDDKAGRFLLAKLYLCYLSLAQSGLDALKQSLDAGYDDFAAFDSLLAAPTLDLRAQVEPLIRAARAQARSERSAANAS